jgi:CRISPR-associated protein Cas2
MFQDAGGEACWIYKRRKRVYSFYVGDIDMLYIVSYDIPDDKKRLRISKTLRDFGTRVQYSVFECIIDDKGLEIMTAKISRLISDEDSVRIYAICAKCKAVVKILGRGKLTEDEDVYII